MKNAKKLITIIALVAVIGFSMAACADPTDTIPGNEDPLTGTVSISGTAEMGQTLTAVTTALGGTGTITYQWKRGNTNIGTNSSTYQVQAADIGSTITVTVTRAGYSGSVISSPTIAVPNPTLPALTGTVSINGTAQVGQTLTADTTALGGSGDISYQWKRGESINIGANSSAYQVQTDDINSRITVTVTRSGNSGSVTSAATATVPSPSSLLDTVALNAKIADAQSLKSQAEVNTAAENVATGAYWVTQAVMTAFENAISAAESALASAETQAALNSAVTALQSAMTIFSGARQEGTKNSGYTSAQVTALVNTAKTDKEGIITAVNGDDVSPVEYWVSSSALEALNTAITALENASGQSAIDTAYLALVQAREAFNNAKQHGTTPDRTALNNALTAADTAKNGVQTAANKDEAASGSSWATTAQLNALNTVIESATAVKNDANATKTAVDAAASNLTTAITVFTTAVSNNGPGTLLPALTGTVSISGTAQVGQTLTAVTTSLGGTGDITYQWKRGSTTIGTNSSTYQVQMPDVGSTITVTVTRAGYSGSVTSDPTAAVPSPNQTTVTNVTVNPSASTVAKGGNQTFTATVTGTNSPAQTVTWSIDETNKNTGTTINASGVLTVATAETLTSLTVRATSTVDTTKSGTATVTISTLVGSGQYASKDVLGNSYSISVGSSVPARSIAARYARAAVKNDRFSMNVTGRDGKTRNAHGKVKDISADGTLTLETDEGVEFTSVIDGDSLESVASDGVEISFDDGTKLTPRTFDTIFLRANRWSSNDPSSGPAHSENLGSGLSVLVKDFPTNVSKLDTDNNRYTITISGTVDRALPHVSVEVQGLTENDEWVFLANNTDFISISAGSFNQTINLNNVTTSSVSHNLLDYKEIILQITDVINSQFDNHPDWNVNNGSLPDNVPNGQIIATISNFKISLKDKNRYAFKGNTNDYTYSFKEDGFSVNYQLAEWSLTPENIAAAKGQNAKFEFIMMDVDDVLNPGTALSFSWQDPVRELWWQDESVISAWDETNGWHLGDGISWDAYRKKLTIELSKVIKDNRFAASTQLNFIVACWYNEGADCRNIGDITITGANIYNVPDCAGNMGNYTYGYEEDGISIQYIQAVWHLPEETLTIAKTDGAKLEIVFNKDVTVNYPTLALVWQDIGSGRWWPTTAEAGADNANIIFFKYELSKSGVTYDTTTKKLTVVLPTALETYSGFKSATDVNFVLTCWYGVTTNINELGIVSANIVGGGSTPSEPVATINLPKNGDYGWQQTYYPASLFNGAKITTGDEYNFTYTFKSDVAIDKLQVLFVDNCAAASWAWNVISGYIEIKSGIAANTEYTGSVVIKATGTATDATPEANRLVLQAGTGTASSPTLTFTAFSLVKK